MLSKPQTSYKIIDDFKFILFLLYLSILVAFSSQVFAAPQADCIEAYQHASYDGKKYTFCADGSGPAHSKWNDRISSFKIGANVKVTVCRDSEGDSGKGVCGTYFENSQSIGYLNDRISFVKVTPYDPTGCINAYQHAKNEGAEYTFCVDGSGTLHTDWNDRISSIKIGKDANLKVKVCQHSEGDSGQGIRKDTSKGKGVCRTYFEDTSSIGFLNDRISYVKVTPFDPKNFTMAIMSDPQYGYCESVICNEADDPKTKHAKSILTLATSSNNFAGVIVNGDITNTVDKWQIENYISDYEDAGLNIYPGLGNHDYDNYVDKWCDIELIDESEWALGWACGACDIMLLKWVVNRIDSIPTINRDYVYNDDDKKDLTGSLAYSFDIGNWHFVQLHNYPTYSRDISSVRTYWFNIRASTDWLKEDLADAKNKNVIINLHVMAADRFPTKSAGYNELKEIVGNNPNVKAIFAGHIHSRIGQQRINDGTDSKTTKNKRRLIGKENIGDPTFTLTTDQNRRVPIYYGGSAENNIYPKVTFKDGDSLENSSLIVTPISSIDGTVKEPDRDTNWSTPGYKHLQNRWKHLQNGGRSAKYLHIGNGKIDVGKMDEDIDENSWSSRWKFEPVAGTSYVRIQSRWDPTQYLHIQKGVIKSGAIQPGWHSAQWIKEPVSGTSYFRIRNRWKSNEYIHIENDNVESGAIETGWHSAQWQEEDPGGQ